eukprot:TRINITY_DN3847_c0_g1_i2.p1 TRINITY_DN3847_c0_g1~~TRINITY_DN3847_c0_g1_i2.p1  ORF type:complete len:180 (+),score=26.51 TRINITY_DN3847_c0_g1_i2:113-652(+)
MYVSTEDEFTRALLEHNSKLVIVLYFAPWQTSVDNLTPVLMDLASVYPDRIASFSVNIDKLIKCAEEREVVNVPTVDFYWNLCRLERLEFPSKERLTKRALVLKDFSPKSTLAQGNFLSRLVMRIIFVSSVAYLFSNMIPFYFPELSARHPSLIYVGVVFLLLLSKKILSMFPNNLNKF